MRFLSSVCSETDLSLSTPSGFSALVELYQIKQRKDGGRFYLQEKWACPSAASFLSLFLLLCMPYLALPYLKLETRPCITRHGYYVMHPIKKYPRHVPKPEARGSQSSIQVTARVSSSASSKMYLKIASESHSFSHEGDNSEFVESEGSLVIIKRESHKSYMST